MLYIWQKLCFVHIQAVEVMTMTNEDNLHMTLIDEDILHNLSYKTIPHIYQLFNLHIT